MRRLVRLGASAVSLLLLAGCGGDIPTSVTSPRLVLALKGDSVIGAGTLVTISSQVADSAGSGLPITDFRWRSSDPSVAEVLCCGQSQVQVRGLSTGVATLTVAYGALEASIPIRVVDGRPIVMLSLGQPVTDTLVNGLGLRRYAIDLAASDTVDMMVTRADSGVGDVLVASTADGLPLTGMRTVGLTGIPDIFPISGGLAATAGGRYFFSAFGHSKYSRGATTPASGPLTFVVRRSGPILSYTVGSRGSTGFVRAGTVTAVDTLFLQNVGTGALQVSIAANGPLIPASNSVTIVQRSSPVYAWYAPAPSGATTVALSFDATAVPLGSAGRGLHLDVPPGTWVMPRTPLDVNISIVVFDGRIAPVGRANLYGVASQSTGPVYAYSGVDVFSLDPSSGATTRIFSATGDPIRRATVSADGVLYVATRDTVLQYRPGQAATRLTLPKGTGTYTGVSAIAGAPDVGIYARVNGVLYRVDAAGTFSALPAPNRVHGQMAYSASDNALYYISSSFLYRYDLTSNVEAVRSSLPPMSAADHVEAVDSQGRLYGVSETIPGLFLYDSQGSMLQHIIVPGTTIRYALNAGQVIGVGVAGISGLGYTWRMPIP